MRVLYACAGGVQSAEKCGRGMARGGGGGCNGRPDWGRFLCDGMGGPIDRSIDGRMVTCLVSLFPVFRCVAVGLDWAVRASSWERCAVQSAAGPAGLSSVFAFAAVRFERGGRLATCHRNMRLVGLALPTRGTRSAVPKLRCTHRSRRRYAWDTSDRVTIRCRRRRRRRRAQCPTACRRPISRIWQPPRQLDRESQPPNDSDAN